MGGLCQVPKIMYTISYAFNIALLIVIIVKRLLSGFLSVYVCFPGCSKTSDHMFYERVLLIFRSIPIMTHYHGSWYIQEIASTGPLTM